MEEWQRSKGKKLTKFKYTYKDIAELTGLTYETVREYARLGKYDPKSLRSTFKFIVAHQ